MEPTLRSIEEIERELTTAGAGFELETAAVMGEEMAVFKNRPRSLSEVLVNSAGFGQAEYLVCDDLRISFADHVGLVARVAEVFSRDHGISKGDRVAILAANCPEWIVCFWATLSLGAIAVGLNGWWVRDEIMYGLADSEPSLLIGDSKRLERVKGQQLPCSVIEIESAFPELWQRYPEAELPTVEIAEDDPATILYTSGTTGRPKGAVSTHGNIIAMTQLQMFHGIRAMMWNNENATAAADVPADKGAGLASTMLCNTPLFHVSGLFAAGVTMLAGGVRTIWMRGRFDPEKVLQLIEKEKVTSWGPMGAMLHRTLGHPDLHKYDLSTIQNLGTGGAPLSSKLQARMRDVFPNARNYIGVGYGLTECTALASTIFGKDLEAHPDSVGRPLPTVSIEVRDPQGDSLGEGEEGEIHIRSPLVMKEYWRLPEATAETILDGRWLSTGDIGRIEDGRLYIATRKRDLILRGAENVYPVEIEQCLESHPAVDEAAVIGVDHEELGQEVKAIVVLDEGASVNGQELATWTAERLAYYKVPAHWEFRSKPLPRNATGKVLKKLLEEGGESAFVDE